jgi:hypothetical protein
MPRRSGLGLHSFPRVRLKARDDLSLAHNDCVFSAAAVRSVLLVYRFASTSISYLNRSARRSPPRIVSPGRINTLYPFPCRSSTLSTLIRTAAPLRAFDTHRIKALNTDSNREVHLDDPPDLRSLPGAQSRFSRNAAGSSFPVRYVSPGSLFPVTSWNHLQDAPKPLNSQRSKRLVAAFLHSIYHACFQKVTWHFSWRRCA